MSKKTLAVCDGEEAYLLQLMTYLETKELPFTIRAYTSAVQLLEFLENHSAEILLLAENAYIKKILTYDIPQILILNESGSVLEGGLPWVNKYQAADSLYREITKYLDVDTAYFPTKKKCQSSFQVIGVYTPVKRCLQTTFAICLGQILAQKHKTLYLNFEAYSGFRQMMHREYPIDITDLLYYFSCERDKLSFRLDGMVEKINQLHYIPPVLSHMDLEAVHGNQWLELIKQMEQSTSYEYLILDLSESMQGLFDILRLCGKVFTIIREDSWAEAKIHQYEELLKMTEYEDVLGKTKKRQLPVFHQIPQRMELLTHGEFASYVKSVIEEDVYEEGRGL